MLIVNGTSVDICNSWVIDACRQIIKLFQYDRGDNQEILNKQSETII
jgi:hypothetical protein